MNILYGLYTQTSGEIYFDGKLVNIDSPDKAIELGIGMVHQHFMLIPALTAIENVVLGMNDTKSHILDLDAAEKKFTELAKRYNMELDKVKELLGDAEKENIKANLSMQNTVTMLANNAVVK